MLRFLELIRWKNLLIIGVTQFFVYFFLREVDSYFSWPDPRLWWLITGTLLLSAAGYLINDYSDIKIDIINKPDKVIVSRYISTRLVLLVHLLFNLAGIAIGLMLNKWLGLINLIVAYLLWRYSVRYKYQLFKGNLLVAFLMSLSLLVIYFPFPGVQLQWLFFYSTFAFLSGLAREIVKDVEDMEGDALYNCRTIPIVYGLFKTKVVLTYLSLSMVFLMAFVIYYLLYWHELIFPAYFILLVLLPLGNVLWILRKADHKKDFALISARMKMIMVLGMLSMALRGVVETRALDRIWKNKQESTGCTKIKADICNHKFRT